MHRLSFFLLPLTFCLGVGPAHGQYAYTVTDLGDLPGGSNQSFGYAINASGQVAGYSAAATGNRAFLWDSVNGMQDLGDLPGGANSSFGVAINASGQVAGYSSAATGPRAFRWDSVNGMQNLGDLPGGADQSLAFGLNTGGQVAGYSAAATGNRAFLWDSVNGMQDLGDLPGGTNQSVAYDVNASGQVVGFSGTTTGDRVFLWDSVNGMQNLGDLPGGVDLSSGSALNDSGQVVGYSGAATGDRAFLWDSVNGMQNLGDLPGRLDRSYGNALNADGQVVGFSDSATGSHAFLWDSVNGMLDLNSLIDPGLGWTLVSALGINDVGQITGYGTIGGVAHAFLLTPSAVPEPATLALFGLAAAGAGAAWWKRRSDRLLAGKPVAAFLLATGVAALLCGEASANDVVYNQPSNSGGGFSIWTSNQDSGGAGFRTYDNFTLSTAHSLIGVNWEGIYYDFITPANNPVAPDTTDWVVSFWSDSANEPGALLQSQTIAASGVATTFLGTLPFDGVDVPHYSYHADISPFAAAAGTPYWLSVQSLSPTFNPIWAWMEGTGGDGFSIQDQLPGSRFTQAGDRTFSLEVQAVPEPATLAMLGLALGGAGVAWRKRRQDGLLAASAE